MELIKHHSRVIASMILERNILNVDEISALIENRILDAISDLVKENATREQRIYDEKLKDVSRHKYGTPKYVEAAFELSKIKRKKALANKAANEMQKNVEYIKLKDFVVENFGREVLNKFLDSLNKKPQLTENQ